MSTDGLEDSGLSILEKWFHLAGLVYQDGGKRGYFRVVFIALHWVYLNTMVATTSYMIGDRSFKDKMDSIQCFVTGTHMIMKCLKYQYQPAPFKKLIKDLREMWNVARNNGKYHEQLQKIRRDTIRTIKTIFIIFIVQVPTTVTIVLVRNLIEEKRHDMYQLSDPLPHDWYYGRLLYQASEMFVPFLIFTLVYSTLLVVCIQIAGQMRLLSLMLASEEPNLRDCVQLHQTIIKVMKDINDFFSGNTVYEAVIWAIQISLRCYQVFITLSARDPQASIAVLFLFLCFSAPCFICMAGHIILVESERLYVSAYQRRWYEKGPDERKALTLVMRQAAKPLRLSYRGFVDFDMVRLSQMLQATYSYLMLLVNADVH